METYIITEQDIERLYRIFPDSGEGLQVCTIVDNWVETLNELPIPKKADLYCDFRTKTNKVEYIVNLVLEEDRIEFHKFLEQNNFIKPEQPYYVKDGKVFDYNSLRRLFLESRENGI